MDSLDNVEYLLAFQRHFVVEFDDEWLRCDRRGVTYGDLWRLLLSLRTGEVAPARRPPVNDPLWRELARFTGRLREIPVDDVCWDACVFPAP